MPVVPTPQVSANGSEMAVTLGIDVACPAANQASAAEDAGGYYDNKTNAQRRVRNHVRELQALGYTVTLKLAA